MNRVLRALLLTCVVLAVALGFLFHHQVPTQQMPFKGADKADAFEISEGSRTVKLVRVSSWTVQIGAISVPADDRKANNSIAMLAAVQVEDEISERADRSGEFQVDTSSGLRITAYQKSKKIGEGIFGKQAPDFAHIYFSFPGKAPVYLAKGIVRAEFEPADADGWRSHEAINLTEAEIQTVAIAHNDQAFTLTRSSDTWTLGDKVVDSAKVYVLLGNLAHLRADTFMDPAQTVSTAEWTVTVGTAKGLTVLHLGAFDKVAQRYPATLDNQPGAFWVPNDKAKMFLLKPSDFPVKN